VAVLEAGADDYIGLPAGEAMLQAHVMAAMRRTEQLGAVN